MAWLRGGILVLCDEILGDAKHRGEVWFQLPASRGESEGSAVKLTHDGGRTVFLQGLAGTAPFQVHRPSSQPGPGWYAPRFGLIRSGTAVSTMSDRSELPLRMVTLVQVGEPGARLSPGVAEVGSDGGVSVCGRGFVVTFPSENGVEWRATG
jgi:hypothetical protein